MNSEWKTGVFVLLCLLFSLSPASSSCADPLDSWYSRNPLPRGNDLRAVAYGNNTFVAVGCPGPILTSPDGVTWTIRPTATDHCLSGVTYGNNMFVAVGRDNAEGYDVILTSHDGIKWTRRPTGNRHILNGITYGNGTFVAVGEENNGLGHVGPGVIMTSPDGVTWTIRSDGVAHGLRGVTFGNGAFVAVGLFYSIFTSHDGVIWTSRSSGLSGSSEFHDIAYGNATFVAISDSAIMTSADGIIWTKSPGTNLVTLRGVTYGNNGFVAVGDQITAAARRVIMTMTSTDGVTWTSQTLGDADAVGLYISLSAITYGNGIFVAVGPGTILTSPDGISWNNRSLGVAPLLKGITCGNEPIPGCWRFRHNPHFARRHQLGTQTVGNVSSPERCDLWQ